jgi:hypothetical protein
MVIEIFKCHRIRKSTLHHKHRTKTRSVEHHPRPLRPWDIVQFSKEKTARSYHYKNIDHSNDRKKIEIIKGSNRLNALDIETLFSIISAQQTTKTTSLFRILLGQWSSGYDVALTTRRSPVQFRPGPFNFLNKIPVSDKYTIFKIPRESSIFIQFTTAIITSTRTTT